LEVALQRLVAEQREVVVLRHVAELSYEEMAEVLQVPEKTVKSRLHSARMRLRELLAEEHGPVGAP
jgi:RNA polymerase sigma-70 factor (ECF subfamily)